MRCAPQRLAPDVVSRMDSEGARFASYLSLVWRKVYVDIPRLLIRARCILCVLCAIEMLPKGDKRLPLIMAAAEEHRRVGLAAVTGKHCEGGHWLGSFAVYLVTRRGIALSESRQLGTSQGHPLRFTHLRCF
jgi:hypothetical protein